MALGEFAQLALVESSRRLFEKRGFSSHQPEQSKIDRYSFTRNLNLRKRKRKRKKKKKKKRMDTTNRDVMAPFLLLLLLLLLLYSI